MLDIIEVSDTPVLRLRNVVSEYADRFGACAETLKHLDVPRAHGRMADWMRINHGRKVTTLQVGPSGAWAPTGRVIDAKVGSTYVLLDDSRRDYAGMRVLHAGSTCLIVYGADTAVAYVLED